MRIFRSGIISLLCFVLFISMVTGQGKKDLLSGSYTPEILKDIIVSAEDFHPFPKVREHESWQTIPEKVRTAHVLQAEKHLNCDWETPKASVFLEYVRNGNRSHYQNVSFGRRVKLAEMVIGECIEGRGRFMDDILNGIWTICEETYWGVPAHVGLQKKGSGLPDVKEPTVDLFAAETGMLLAWTYYLLGDQLDGISPLIRERIHHEVHRRILYVNLERDDFWWMGFGGRLVNNWNPWICSNWLTAVLILEKNPERRVQSIYKIMRCLDNFMNPYPRDGGCDEGPSYWGRAGGSLYDCLELLHLCSGGRINIFDESLVREIGKYITRVYIHDRYYINFADAAARLNGHASIIFRYGRQIEDEAMKGFGAFLAKQQKIGEHDIRGSFGCLGRVLPTLFHLGELLKAEPKIPLAGDFWLPDLQVMGARSRGGSKDGLYVAAKGGHNAESHNHNDVGNFIVYCDGYPAIIDVGVETYTAKTFSNKRYEIWTMQSAYHNCPIVNGVMQKDGREYEATDVVYEAREKDVVFSLDLSGAYPEEARLKSWKRTITLNRDKNVTVEDFYELEEVRQNMQMILMCWREPDMASEGKIILKNPEEIEDLKTVFITFDQDRFRVDFETIPMEDGRLRSSWGERLFRIVFTARETLLKDEFRFTIEQGE